MKYKVIKKFYDPFLKRRVQAGEEIEVEKKYLDGYIGYIEIPNAVELKEVIEQAVKEPVVEVAIRAAKKRR